MDADNPTPNQPVSFDDSIDMDAINAAVTATSGASDNTPHAFDVNKISLSDTPTTGEELEKQREEHPEIGLTGSTAASTGENSSVAGPSVDTLGAVQDSANAEIAQFATATSTESGESSSSTSGEKEQTVDDTSTTSTETPANSEADISAAASNDGDKLEETDFTIDSEKSSNKAKASLNQASAKAQDQAMKALQSLKPKNTVGVVVFALVGALLVVAVLIAIIYFVGL